VARKVSKPRNAEDGLKAPVALRRVPSDPVASTAGVTPSLDRIIHERMRLGIISALAVNESLTFNDLKRLLNSTDGNLSVHARRLEDAGYVTCSKSFDGRLPRTEYRITSGGRAALEHYLSHMEALIRSMRKR
jgi:DNA-binding transcriptional ArsR family regulator